MQADIHGFFDLLGDVDDISTSGVHLPAEYALLGGGQQAPAVDMDAFWTGHGELILLVDDEQDILTVERAGLEAYGYVVLTASGGVQALADYALNRRRIAAVVIDLMMPALDGFVVIEIIRRMSRYVPIIATSGLHSSGVLGQASRAGMTSFLAKPHTVEELLDRLSAELLLAHRCPAP